MIKFLRGYVKIRISGYSAERFLNLCSSRGILIWDLENCGNAYEMYMSVKGFRQLQPIVRKTKIKVRIVSRFGMPFFLHKYRKRKMFFAGILLCGVCIYVLSLFIWDIEFEGNSARTSEVLLQFLEENHLHHGMLKSRIDCEDVEAILRDGFQDIIWASVEIKGTRLIVYVQEGLDIDETKQPDTSEPTDLCAEKEGIIETIITRAGMPLVDVGTEVSEGAVLVQGRIEIADDSGEVVNYHYCAADADIYMRCVYPYEDQFSMVYEKKEYEKEEQKSFFVKTFERTWDLGFWKKRREENYESVSDERQLHLWNHFYLPFYWGCETTRYYKKTEQTYTEEEAQTLASQNLQKFCEDLEKKGVQIVENNVTIQVDENLCRASGNLIVIEKAGVRKPTEILDLQQEQEEQNEYNGADTGNTE